MYKIKISYFYEDKDGDEYPIDSITKEIPNQREYNFVAGLFIDLGVLLRRCFMDHEKFQYIYEE